MSAPINTKNPRHRISRTSGAVPITIIERVGVCSISTGGKFTGLVSTVWLNSRYAPPVHMVKLTETLDITPYPWVHPDEDDRR
jgi:hypothetical protein